MDPLVGTHFPVIDFISSKVDPCPYVGRFGSLLPIDVASKAAHPPLLLSQVASLQLDAGSLLGTKA